jgi:hypothetical protein
LISTGVACVGSIGIPAVAAADRNFCCWRIDVRATGIHHAAFAARDAFAAEDIGFKEKYDVDGESRFDFTWTSRGLYRYRESGRAREPSFDNLFAGGRRFARAARARSQLDERSDYCIYDPPKYETREDGNVYAVSQECIPPAEGRPCQSDQVRPWEDGSGVQIVGRRASRRIAVDAGNNFPAARCDAPGHGTSNFLDHNMKQGPSDFALPVARSTGASLRRQRTFAPQPFKFEKNFFHPTDSRSAQPHGGFTHQTVRIRFTYFAPQRLGAERRALTALR